MKIVLNKEHISSILNQFRSNIKQNIISSGKWTTGQTFNGLNITYKEVGNNYQFGFSSTNPEAFEALETGRKPGKMPPVQSILNWMTEKGIEGGLNKAWAISMKIAKEGTEQFRKGKADVYSSLFNRYRNKITDEVSKDITKNVKSLFNKK